jgi:hypothetical protein
MPHEIGPPTLCMNWREWAEKPNLHPPFNYWRWDERNHDTSIQRLGERIYVGACLLWTSLHDRHIGNRLASSYPNWATVCYYYSIVHALRLLWFFLYGSYPTSHSAMAKVLSTEQGTRANWGRDTGVPPGKAVICSSALKGAIAEGLGQPTLAARLPEVGTVFASAIRLREDSNYESLILAHQYIHRSMSRGTPGWIDVVK